MRYPTLSPPPFPLLFQSARRCSPRRLLPRRPRRLRTAWPKAVLPWAAGVLLFAASLPAEAGSPSPGSGDDSPFAPLSEPADPAAASRDPGRGEGRRSPFTISIAGAYVEQTTGKESFGMTLLLGIPLDRLGKPAAPAGFLADPIPLKPAPAPELKPAPGPFKPPPEPPPPPKLPVPLVTPEDTLRVPVRVTPELAREAVRAALRRARLTDPEAAVDAFAARARKAALLPDLRFRAAHILNDGAALAPTEYDPTRLTETDTTQWLFEVRVSWKLDQLVFSREEMAVERLRQERTQAQVHLTSQVLQELFAWQRALAMQEDYGLAADQRLEATLKVIEAEAQLDLLTDGWFTRFRERTKVGSLPPT